jgi:general secretion pathway protein A
VGQPQFKEMLADPSLEQFRQRVIASYHLGPMSEEETAGYIRHRLTLVGWRNDPAIEPEAFDLIYRHSGGIPRRINTLCSRLLLYGALEGLHIIDAPAVQDVIADLRTEVTEAPSKPLAAKVNGHAANGHEVGHAVNGHEVASLMASIEQLTDTVNSHDRALRQLLETALEMLAVNSATTNSATVVKAGDADERA